ncbi:Crp/Fnr family transcriptional regulator [Sphingopyxis sp.]|uniref:Crp/Fnr family transcriptional regulator n=1 Tax=Sphingopyxis sp. TaxID=1908224 RepID=UPI002D786390|nr:Crp/Fnr family transcriptional regulator [Sphingopyxis sp.]HET6526835.1 Crp/Fnr family transcriptional regulator [Sphingopyxis sp.]
MPFHEILNRVLPASERTRWETSLARNAKDFPKGYDLVREGDAPRSLHVVLSGWVQKHRQLADGRRQILAFFLPGQICDLDLFTVMRTTSSLAVASRATVAEIGRDEASHLLAACPHLPQVLSWSEIVSSAIQAEWMTSIGQRNALERVAHLLCELYVRQHADKRGGECDFPLTQSQMADATGLTSVHVNRTIQHLRRRAAIEIGERRLLVPDFSALAAIGCFDPHYLHLGEAGLAIQRAALLFRSESVSSDPFGNPRDIGRSASLKDEQRASPPRHELSGIARPTTG